VLTPAKKTQAIALVQAGLTIAVMLGVPFGSFLGGFENWSLNTVNSLLIFASALKETFGTNLIIPNIVMIANTIMNPNTCFFKCRSKY
jgi:DHA1 family inner membrane transport protein